MMEKKYQIGLVQAAFTNGDVGKNLEQMKRIVETTKEQFPDVKLMLFPELATTGYFLSAKIREFAEDQNGMIAKYMADLASKNDLHIAYGYVESGIHGEIFNSLRFIDSHGEPVANCRKIHITSLEKGIFTPGNEIVSIKTELGHIGLMICWDLAFPEVARTLAVRGADLILNPSAWEKPYVDPFLRFGMARAIDNTVYVAVCNHVGKSNDLEFLGHSGLYGPDGASIAMAGEVDEKVIVAEVDPLYQRNVQSTFFTMLTERRKDLYALIGEEE
jgi:predicted amidohydrolase